MPTDLWGDLPDGSGLRSPKEILEEQAAILGKKTKGKIEGNLSMPSVGDSTSKMVFDFNLVAPFLSNYVFTVLRINYPIDFYPLNYRDLANGKNWVDIDTEEEFVAVLGDTLGSERVHRVIASILAQST